MIVNNGKNHILEVSTLLAGATGREHESNVFTDHDFEGYAVSPKYFSGSIIVFGWGK